MTVTVRKFVSNMGIFSKCIQQRLMFSLCSVVCPAGGGGESITQVAAEASYDRTRSFAL